MIGCVPVQPPAPALSVWPARAVPEIVGGAVLTGADEVARTAVVGVELAVAEPTELVAVTVTRRVAPTSALVTA